MIITKINDELLKYTKENYNKNYKEKCILHRRTTKFTIYSDEKVIDFFRYKFFPYVNIEVNSSISEELLLNGFKVYLNCSHFDLDLDMNFLGEEINIMKNNKDNRKNIQCRRISLERFNIFIINKSGNLIILDKVLKTFFISGSNLEYQLEDLRVVIRDLINIGIINEGFVEVHASAVADAQGGVSIICGNSNSGKTTILFDHLKSKFNLVSNGRIYVKNVNDNLIVLGTPESIYIRPISFRIFPEIKSILNGEEIATAKLYDKNCHPSDKIKSHFKEVCEVFGCIPVKDGLLNEIIFPLLSQPNKDINLKQVIQNNVFEYNDICRREWTGASKINSDFYEINKENVNKRLAEYPNKTFVFRQNDNYIYNRGN